jgi:hypothetical protein
MEQKKEEFFHDFRQELLASAEADGSFFLSAFMEIIAREIVETGFCDGFELCHYRAQRGMRVDGYWFNDEGSLDLFIADFDNRVDLTSLSKTEVAVLFKRLTNFLEACISKGLAQNLEVTSPEYGLARQIADRIETIDKVNLFLFSERSLSDKIQEIPDTLVAGIPTNHQIWDMSRLHRQSSSKNHKEVLSIDFVQMFGKGIASLPAHLTTHSYQSYLMVMPADVLAELYDTFRARLLEQNVRTFLQARGSVNKGIRETILKEPYMFFAYNNGITATAQSIETRITDTGLTITKIVDLQIVNGGQTTASLFHTRKRDKADLSQIFVQMKLSVIDSQQSDLVVPKISEYANTQNKVNAADFFSNHPFHVRMEGFSRRLWAPAKPGAQRETRWFYERTRGQYADEQSKFSIAEQRRFKAEHPKSQMFTKTDLAKYENVWDDHPKWVNLGSQKNFKQYAERIGIEWEKSPDSFNEFYFKRAVARSIIFRNTERIVSSQSWYNGGYRANIVAYTLSVISEITKRRKEYIDYLKIWTNQNIDSVLEGVIEIVSKMVNDIIIKPPHGISNISEWCKREACWKQLTDSIELFSNEIPLAFFNQLITDEIDSSDKKSAKLIQKIDNGLEAQKRVINISIAEWSKIYMKSTKEIILNEKEISALKIAMQIPSKIPTEKQSLLLLDILEKAKG